MTKLDPPAPSPALDSSGPPLLSNLKLRSENSPDAPSLLAPGRGPLTYGRLYEHVAASAAALSALGLGRGDRLALVLSNGPEMASAFLASIAVSTCAPLNPSYSKTEFEFYLSDLGAKALLVEKGLDTAAVGAAESSNVPVVLLEPRRCEPAGLFSLDRDPAAAGVNSRWANADDVALVLHTSGTTARPKIVPLTHANLWSSATQIAAALELSSSDRCLNIMPLFHVHGLVGAVLSTLASGGSVVCASGFTPQSTIDFLRDHRPTWLTAVPTMHQAVLERLAQTSEEAPRHSLRFIRSCSAALAPETARRLESIFGVPVVEAYGMTEASHQIACNPLPLRPRKFGSVGLPAGCEVAAFDEGGNALPADSSGEIAILGANVTSGYENNPAANASAFSGRWLRTGDCGHIDPEGYIFLESRIKEIINSGGEKISPREIDEALQAHPAVFQAVAFAVPHPELGEAVAAAVVLRPGAAAEPVEIRQFAARRLAPFKVPRRIVVLAAIPKGPTGKIQRIGLAEKLGITAAPESGTQMVYVPPETPLERLVAEVWAEVLSVTRIGVHDDFLAIGGDSLRAGQIVSRIGERAGIQLQVRTLFENPTIAELAEMIERLLPDGSGPSRPTGS